MASKNLCGVCRGIYIPMHAECCESCSRLHPDELAARTAEDPEQHGDDFSPRSPAEV